MKCRKQLNRPVNWLSLPIQATIHTKLQLQDMIGQQQRQSLPKIVNLLESIRMNSVVCHLSINQTL